MFNDDRSMQDLVNQGHADVGMTSMLNGISVTRAIVGCGWVGKHKNESFVGVLIIMDMACLND